MNGGSAELTHCVPLSEMYVHSGCSEQTLRGYESLAEFAPDWISAPGETMADLLEERGWSQADFATRTGFTKKHVHLLLQSKAAISEDTALRLERVLGSSARFWMSLETQYCQT